MFHPIINIEIDKSYPIRKYSEKLSPEKMINKLRDISEDKLHWSKKILDAIQAFIIEKALDIPYDLLEIHRTTTNSVNYKFDRDIRQLNKAQIIETMKNELDSKDQQSTQTTEVYLQNKEKYKEFDDIHMAYIILILSHIAKYSDKLWVSVTLQIRELKSAILYFQNEDGHIVLSERSKNISERSIRDYINSMNELIDGKRQIPGVNE